MLVPVHSATRRRSTGRGSVEARRRLRLEVEPVLGRVPRDDDGGEDHRHVFPRLAGQQLGFCGQLPEIADVGLLDGALEPAGAAVVRGEGQMPVAAKQVGERPQVLRGRKRRLLGIGALVDIPVAPQPVLDGRAGHELPDAFGLGARQRIRLERALHEGHVGEVERQPFGAEDVLDHRKVLAAPPEALFDEVVETPLKELHVREDALVQGDWHVVDACVRLDGIFHFGGRGRGSKRRRQRQQLVDRRRFVLRFREAVAGGEGADFVGADPVYQTIEVLADARLGAGAVRRLEQDVDCFIELLPRGLEVTLIERRLPGPEMPIRFGDQRQDRIFDRFGLCDRQRRKRRFRRGRGGRAGRDRLRGA
jgi:hypothetical protein